MHIISRAFSSTHSQITLPRTFNLLPCNAISTRLDPLIRWRFVYLSLSLSSLLLAFSFPRSRSLSLSLLSPFLTFYLVPPFFKDIPPSIEVAVPLVVQWLAMTISKATRRWLTLARTSRSVPLRDEPASSIAACFPGSIWAEMRATGPWGPALLKARARRR